MGLGWYGPGISCCKPSGCNYTIKINSFGKTVLGTAPTVGPPIVTQGIDITDVCNVCFPDGCRLIRFVYVLTATDVDITIQCQNEAGDWGDIQNFQLPLPPTDTCQVWTFPSSPCDINIRICCNVEDPFDMGIDIDTCPWCTHYPDILNTHLLVRRPGGGLDPADYNQSPLWNGLLLPPPAAAALMRWTTSDPYELFEIKSPSVTRDDDNNWLGSVGLSNTEHPFYAPRVTTSSFTAGIELSCGDSGPSTPGTLGLPILTATGIADSTHDATNGCDADGCINPFNRGKLLGVGTSYRAIVFDNDHYIDLSPPQVFGPKDDINAAQNDFPCLQVELETPGYNWSGVLPSNFQNLSWSTAAYEEEKPYYNPGTGIETYGFTNDTGIIGANMPATLPYNNEPGCVGVNIGDPSQYSYDQMTLGMNCDGSNLTWQWARRYGWEDPADSDFVCAIGIRNSVLNGDIAIPTKSNPVTTSVFSFAAGNTAIGLTDVVLTLTGSLG